MKLCLLGFFSKIFFNYGIISGIVSFFLSVCFLVIQESIV